MKIIEMFNDAIYPSDDVIRGERLIFVLDVDSIIIVCYLKNWAVVVPLLEEQSLLTLEMSIS